MILKCPNCATKLGSPAHEGGTRIRLSIVVIDDDGTIHGPCAKCKRDVVVAHGGSIEKTLMQPERKPGRRRLVVPKA